tara:strand:+ start:5997 stop:6248 length:252 start_codon:yes stop_codon:yes gene_type:complete
MKKIILIITMLLTAAGTVMADNPKFDAFGNLITYAHSDNGTGSDNSNDSNHDNGTGSDNSNDSNHDGGSDHGNDGGNDNDHDG